MDWVLEAQGCEDGPSLPKASGSISEHPSACGVFFPLLCLVSPLPSIPWENQDAIPDCSVTAKRRQTRLPDTANTWLQGVEGAAQLHNQGTLAG